MAKAQRFPFRLFRYVASEVTIFFIGCLLAFIGILLAVNLLKFASLIVTKGVAFSQILMVFASLIPTFLEISVPMSTLLGVMLAFARLSGDSELIVIRASGISLFWLIFPVSVFGVIVTALSLYVSFVGRPWGYDTLNQTLYSIASDSTTAGIDEGVFSKLGDMTLYAEKLDHQTGNMQHVMLDDRRDAEDRKIIFAHTGSINSDQKTKQLYISLENGEIHQEESGKYAVTHFQKNLSVIDSSELFEKDQNRKGKLLSAMSLEELNILKLEYEKLKLRIITGEVIDLNLVNIPYGQTLSKEQLTIREISKRLNRIVLEGGRRLSMPFAALVLSLIGMSLGIQPPRTQRTFGAGLAAIFGIAVFVIYYGVLSIGIALAEGSVITPLIALWLPNIVVLLIGGTALNKLGKENWQSITEALELNIMYIYRKARNRFQL